MDNRTKDIIETFDTWAVKGKDKGMEEGHASSVSRMIDIVQSSDFISKTSFSALDLGCGNGWMARKIKEIPNCESVIGVDGANSMIENAKNIDPSGNYIVRDINNWTPNNKINLVISMEVFYYLDDPKNMLLKIYNQFLDSPGMIVIGIDHYKENIPSLKWPSQLNLDLRTLSENNWKVLLTEAGFNRVESETTPSNRDWNGTLILTGFKD